MKARSVDAGSSVGVLRTRPAADGVDEEGARELLPVRFGFGKSPFKLVGQHKTSPSPASSDFEMKRKLIWIGTVDLHFMGC